MVFEKMHRAMTNSQSLSKRSRFKSRIADKKDKVIFWNKNVVTLIGYCVYRDIGEVQSKNKTENIPTFLLIY